MIGVDLGGTKNRRRRRVTTPDARATAPGSVAADGARRNGLYTERLLASLREPDSDIDKVSRRIAVGVSIATNGKQVPWIASSLTGDFYFRPSATSSPPHLQDAGSTPTRDDAAIELTFWQSI